jgi:hypothetical protein
MTTAGDDIAAAIKMWGTVEEFVRQQFPDEPADKQEALAGCVMATILAGAK